jgi:hypothetical protein
MTMRRIDWIVLRVLAALVAVCVISWLWSWHEAQGLRRFLAAGVGVPLEWVQPPGAWGVAPVYHVRAPQGSEDMVFYVIGRRPLPLRRPCILSAPIPDASPLQHAHTAPNREEAEQTARRALQESLGLGPEEATLESVKNGDSSAAWLVCFRLRDPGPWLLNSYHVSIEKTTGLIKAIHAA